METDDKQMAKQSDSPSPSETLCIPPEIMEHIFRHLPTIEDKGRCARVCRYWNSVCDQPNVWQGTAKKIRLTRLVDLNMATLSNKGIERVDLCIYHPTYVTGIKLDHVISCISGLTALRLTLRTCRTDIKELPMFLGNVATKQKELKLVCKLASTSGTLGANLFTKNLKNLVRLEIFESAVPEVTDTLIRIISLELKNLKHLLLRGCSRITNDSIRHLAEHDSNDDGPPQLDYLEIVDSMRLSDEALIHLSAGQPLLQFLCISMTDAMSDVGLQHLARMAHLQRVNLVLHLNIINVTKLVQYACVHISDVRLLYGRFADVRRSACLYFLDARKQIVSCRNCCPPHVK